MIKTLGNAPRGTTIRLPVHLRVAQSLDEFCRLPLRAVELIHPPTADLAESLAEGRTRTASVRLFSHRTSSMKGTTRRSCSLRFGRAGACRQSRGRAGLARGS